MGYVPLLSGRPFPIDIDECDEEDGFVVSVPIAISQDQDRIVTIDSKLIKDVHFDRPFWEFSFDVSVVSLEDPEDIFSTMDRSIVRNYIPNGARPLVMEIVCDSCRHLVEEVWPDRVYRVTKATQPPPKALRKHRRVTSVFEALGYHVSETGYDRWDRLFWVLERNRG